MRKASIIIAGFGGQGILFAGKFLAYKGLLEGFNVSWLPSYGPEMRGGTANCSVIIDEKTIGSPIISEPDILIAMNGPSLDKLESQVKPGGIIIADSSIITREVVRTDVKAVYVPATQLASENGLSTLANMILIGKLLEVMGEGEDMCNVMNVLEKVVSAKRAELKDYNFRALKLGYNYLKKE